MSPNGHFWPLKEMDKDDHSSASGDRSVLHSTVKWLQTSWTHASSDVLVCWMVVRFLFTKMFPVSPYLFSQETFSGYFWEDHTQPVTFPFYETTVKGSLILLWVIMYSGLAPVKVMSLQLEKQTVTTLFRYLPLKYVSEYFGWLLYLQLGGLRNNILHNASLLSMPLSFINLELVLYDFRTACGMKLGEGSKQRATETSCHLQVLWHISEEAWYWPKTCHAQLTAFKYGSSVQSCKSAKE